MSTGSPGYGPYSTDAQNEHEPFHTLLAAVATLAVLFALLIVGFLYLPPPQQDVHRTAASFSAAVTQAYDFQEAVPINDETVRVILLRYQHSGDLAFTLTQLEEAGIRNQAVDEFVHSHLVFERYLRLPEERQRRTQAFVWACTTVIALDITAPKVLAALVDEVQRAEVSSMEFHHAVMTLGALKADAAVAVPALQQTLKALEAQIAEASSIADLRAQRHLDEAARVRKARIEERQAAEQILRALAAITGDNSLRQKAEELQTEHIHMRTVVSLQGA